LEFILTRYQKLYKKWERIHLEFEQINNGKKLSDNQSEHSKLVFDLFNKDFEIKEEIQLYIESFYLFSKILLDKVAIAIWQYFGRVQEKGLTLSSNDDLTKHLKKYAEIKSINLPDDILIKAQLLRNSISDFRDWQISHERNPERKIKWSRMTILDRGALKLRINRFFSKEKKETIFSHKLNDLQNEIFEYIVLVVKLIKDNRKLTTYTLK